MPSSSAHHPHRARAAPADAGFARRLRVPRALTLLTAALFGGLAGCASKPETLMPTVPYVDLDRFMGDWYVIGNIPTFLERNAYNAIERYTRADDGSIETTFEFNAGAPDGPRKIYRPRGFIVDTASNAVWGMQFVWPIKADYRVVYLSDDYAYTAIGRNARDYVWIMARTPHMPEADYAAIVAQLAALGYDPARIRRVPQSG